MWDLAHPGDPLELGTDSGWIYAVAALPDGRVVAGGESRRVLVWDPAHPAADRLQLGTHKESVRAIATLPDGRVVSVGNDQIRVWNPNRPNAGSLDLGAPPSRAWAVAALIDGRVVTAGHGQLCIWDPAHPSTNPLVFDPLTVDVGNRWLNAVAALPDGRFVTGDDNRRVRIWDPIHLDRSPLELGAHSMPVQAVAVSPDGRVISAGEDEDDQLLMWDPSYVGIREADLDTSKSNLRALAILPDGRVITAGYQHRVRIWDPSHPGSDPLNLTERESIFAVAILPDGRVVVGRDRIMLWDPADPSNPTYRDSPHHSAFHSFRVMAMAALPDGRLVSGGTDRWIYIWDPDYVPPIYVVSPGSWEPPRSEDTSNEPIFLGTHDGPVLAVAVLVDGRIVSGGADHRIRVWNPTQPHASPTELGSHEGEVRAIAVLPDGRIVSGGADRRVRVWKPVDHTLSEQIACSVTALATGTSATGQTFLVIAQEGGGLTGIAVP